MSQSKKIKPVCADCGSENVSVDAFAEWDTQTQKWSLQAIFEQDHICHECESTTSLKWVPV